MTDEFVTLAPGATIGILGGGQLGRMLAIAAAQLGFRCHVYAPPATTRPSTSRRPTPRPPGTTRARWSASPRPWTS
jgi:lactate dehydrogenase-like 2-hydroxyacid dehydrogenase